MFEIGLGKWEGALQLVKQVFNVDRSCVEVMTASSVVNYDSEGSFSSGPSHKHQWVFVEEKAKLWIVQSCEEYDLCKAYADQCEDPERSTQRMLVELESFAQEEGNVEENHAKRNDEASFQMTRLALKRSAIGRWVKLRSNEER